MVRRFFAPQILRSQVTRRSRERRLPSASQNALLASNSVTESHPSIDCEIENSGREKSVRFLLLATGCLWLRPRPFRKRRRHSRDQARNRDMLSGICRDRLMIRKGLFLWKHSEAKANWAPLLTLVPCWEVHSAGSAAMQPRADVTPERGHARGSRRNRGRRRTWRWRRHWGRT